MPGCYAFWAGRRRPAIVQLRKWLRLDIWPQKSPFSSAASLWYDTLVWEYDLWIRRILTKDGVQVDRIEPEAWQSGPLPNEYWSSIESTLNGMPLPERQNDFGITNNEQAVLLRWLFARSHNSSKRELNATWARVKDRRAVGTRPWWRAEWDSEETAT